MTTGELLGELARAIDLAVVERLPNAGYIMVTPPPDWLQAALEPAPTLAGAFPFLGHFLQIAGDTWRSGTPGRTESGPFEATVRGESLLLRATALNVHQHHLLVIERLTGTADPREMLQRAREQMLAHEALERQASAVHGPAATVARVVAALVRLPLAPDAKPLVDELTTASAALDGAVRPLPRPPKGRRVS